LSTAAAAAAAAAAASSSVTACVSSSFSKHLVQQRQLTRHLLGNGGNVDLLRSSGSALHLLLRSLEQRLDFFRQAGVTD